MKHIERSIVDCGEVQCDIVMSNVYLKKTFMMEFAFFIQCCIRIVIDPKILKIDDNQYLTILPYTKCLKYVS